jgi:phosphoacetylglucosamine mutase
MKYLNCTEVKTRCLDCANGIGGKIIPHFEQELQDLIKLDLINNKNPEALNKKCGADFIKVDKTFPTEYEPQIYNCFVSFDGDADRIV